MEIKIRMVALLIAMLFVNTVEASDAPHSMTGVLRQTQTAKKKKDLNVKRKIERDWTGLTAKAQEEIVNLMAVALDSFAQSITNFSRDTEALESAKMAHRFSIKVTSGKYSFMQNMALIYNMEAYVCYGMRYEPGILVNSIAMAQGYLTDHSIVYQDQNMIEQMNAACGSLFNSAHFSYEAYKRLAIQTLDEFNQLYTYLNALTGINTFDENVGLQSAIHLVADSLDVKKEYSPKNQFRAICLMENNYFAITFLSLLKAMEFSESEWKQVSDMLVNFFEANKPFLYAAMNGDLKNVSDEVFEHQLLAETLFKAKIYCIMADKLNNSKTIGDFEIPFSIENFLIPSD